MPILAIFLESVRFILLIAAAEKAGEWTLARALLRERMELRPHSAGNQAHYQAALAAPLP